MHDTVRCDILRAPIVHLGARSLAPGQPTFAMSRLTLQLRFVKLDEDSKIRSRTDTTGTAATTAVLEYIDARIHLSDSMAIPQGADTDGRGEPLDFLAPLHLADALAGDQHYERIIRGGNALTSDLKTANENREESPKPRPTGGFIVKDGGAPVVGMLGATWQTETRSMRSSRTGRHVGIDSSITSASAPLEAIHEESCSASHWTGDPSGSGTSDIVFQLCPLAKCSTCGVRPLHMVHLGAKTPVSARTPTSLSAKTLSGLVPNKSFRLVAHLLNMNNEASHPEEFFAHVRIVFYFTDDDKPDKRDAAEGEKACCGLKKHVFTASIKIGKEGDAKLKQKKAVDFNDALARLEGKTKLPASPRVRPNPRRAKTEASKTG